MEIREKFRKYLNSLGYSDEDIDLAWLKAKNNHPIPKYRENTSEHRLLIEIATRDLLELKGGTDFFSQFMKNVIKK